MYKYLNHRRYATGQGPTFEGAGAGQKRFACPPLEMHSEQGEVLIRHCSLAFRQRRANGTASVGAEAVLAFVERSDQ